MSKENSRIDTYLPMIAIASDDFKHVLVMFTFTPYV